MTNRIPKNIAASIHQKLLNVSKQTSRPFNDLVMYYSIERFLYRLSQSRYSDRLILKGGLMLNVWNAPVTRITRDIDLLGKLNNDLEGIKKVIQEICATEVEEDGLTFNTDTITTMRIAEDANYEGVRAKFKGQFGKMPLAMQVDFGFSDTVNPEPVEITYPCVMNHPPARLLAYNRETVVAEKFEAMVKLGELNSRMKDFFDIWALADNFYFDGSILSNTIQATFERRKTNIEFDLPCFNENFARSPSKTAQWKGFIKTSRVTDSPSDFIDVLKYIQGFLEPIALAMKKQQKFDLGWEPGGPWA